MRGIARNLARQARDKAGPIAALVTDVPGGDPREDSIADEEARLTWAALGELPETYREALVLYYWEEQSAREVAAALEISEQAVLQRLSRGRSLLREEVLSRVEGALRRGRPGAAMTATIVAAVAMSSQTVANAATSTSVDTASTPSVALARMGVARKGALAIAGVVVTLVVAFVVYTRGHTALASTAGTSSTATAAFTADPAARMESGEETGSVDRVATPGQVPTPGAMPGATAADDHGGDLDGRYVVIDVEAGLHASNEVRQAATRCFVDAWGGASARSSSAFVPRSSAMPVATRVRG